MYVHVHMISCAGISTSVLSPGTSVTPVAAPSEAPAADSGLLVNVLGDTSLGDIISSSALPQSSKDPTPGSEDGFNKFLFKNNGVLFENDVLQIGVKSEFKRNLGTYFISKCPK